MDNITIQLQDPIVYQDKRYDKLVLKKFRAKHFKHLPPELLELEYDDPTKISKKQSLDIALSCMPLFASLAEVPLEVIEELCIQDLFKVVEQFGPFLEKSLSSEAGGK